MCVCVCVRVWVRERESGRGTVILKRFLTVDMQNITEINLDYMELTIAGYISVMNIGI